jgi:hypothetical protein
MLAGSRAPRHPQPTQQCRTSGRLRHLARPPPTVAASSSAVSSLCLRRLAAVPLGRARVLRPRDRHARWYPSGLPAGQAAVRGHTALPHDRRAGHRRDERAATALVCILSAGGRPGIH